MTPEEKKNEKLTVLKTVQKFIYAGIGGVVGTMVIYPLDFCKTRLQNQVQKPDGTLQYRGMIHFYKTFVPKYGVRALYSGLLANVVGVTPEKAIKLGINDIARNKLDCNDPSKFKLFPEVASAIIAGTTQVVATCPMERSKILMQMKEDNRGLWQVVKEQGLTGMYRGSAATVVRDVFFSILYFPLYSYLKYLLYEDRPHTISELVLAGSGAGIVGAGLSTPLDVVKTRVQTSPGETLRIVPTAVSVLKNEGIRAFFKGTLPRIATFSPLFGIALMVFEKLQQYLL